MKKHIRLLSKTLNGNLGCACLLCVVMFIVFTYLFFLSPFLKNLLLNESNKWGSFRTSSFKSAYIPLELQTEHYKRCGMKMKCSANSFPIHLFTGVKNEEFPQICINEKKLPATRIGRGFNVVIINNLTSKIIRQGHFDIFTETSERLEIFLEVMNTGDIVVIVTHDEASTKLSARTRNLLNELGSAYIQDLDYRDVWVFVGQKGINGFSSYEYIEYLRPGSNWPDPINKKFCVPNTLIGAVVRSDPMPRANPEKDVFCVKSNLKNSFCSKSARDPIEGSVGAVIENSSTSQVPIVIVPGPDINLFRMQAEALLLNKGLILADVHVFCHKDEIQILQIAQFFKFKIHHLNDSLNFLDYTSVLHEAITKTWELFHTAQYCIILEEGVIPGNDFLSFMSFAQQILQKDASLTSASAWNGNDRLEPNSAWSESDHGFSRTNFFPGFGILMRRSTYEKYLRNKLIICCNKSSWEGWNLSFPIESIVPRISRAFKVLSLPDEDSELFKAQNTFIQRAYSPDQIENITLPEHSLLAQEISSCTILSNEIVMNACLSTEVNTRNTLLISQTFCICYEQENAVDSRILNFLLSCFEDDGHMSLRTLNQITGVTTVRDNVLAIGSLSPVMAHLPKIHEVFTNENVKAVEKLKWPLRRSMQI